MSWARFIEIERDHSPWRARVLLFWLSMLGTLRQAFAVVVVLPLHSLGPPLPSSVIYGFSCACIFPDISFGRAFYYCSTALANRLAQRKIHPTDRHQPALYLFLPSSLYTSSLDPSSACFSRNSLLFPGTPLAVFLFTSRFATSRLDRNGETPYLLNMLWAILFFSRISQQNSEVGAPNLKRSSLIFTTNLQ